VAVRFGVLGPLQVEADGRPVAVNGRRRRAVLLRLLLAADGAVPADALAEDVWDGDPPAGWRSTLQSHVSVLRQALGTGALTHGEGGYRLERSPEDLDADRVARAVAGARRHLDRGRPAPARALLEGALAEWRGPALADVAGSAWARPELSRLEELQRSAEEALGEARLALGEHAALVGELEAAVGRHPLREPLWGQLMLALYRSGRQADALRAFQRLRALLAEELGLEPGPALVALDQAIVLQRPELDHEAPATPAPGAPPPRAPGTLVGRGAELEALESALAAQAVVTLTGPGGIGKTRLALEAARRAVAADRAVAWVDLSGLTDGTLVAPEVGRALGLPEDQGRPAAQALAEGLSDRALLLVLDNCEHVVDEVAALVAAVVPRCPGLRVLATGRQALGVPGEARQRIGGLAVPPPGQPVRRPADLQAYDAVRLFAERAGLARGLTGLDDRAAAALASVCRRLDGVPLALELASAWAGTLSLPELDDRLARTLDTPPGAGRGRAERHRTLAAVFDWSDERLAAPERDALHRLAVCRGGAGLPLAAAVCGSDPDRVAGHLAALVDKSLVATRPGPGGSTRYVLGETVRRFALDRAGAAGVADEAAGRLAGWVGRFGADQGRRLEGPQAEEAVVAVEAELENVRAALEWFSARGRWEAVAGLVASLGWFFLFTGRLAEADAWLARAADALGPAPSAGCLDLAWARLFVASHRLERHEELVALGQELAEAARAGGAPGPEGRARGQLALHRLYQGRPGAEAELAAARDLSGRAGDGFWDAYLAVGQAVARQILDRYDEALPLYDRAEAAVTADGSPQNLAYYLGQRALLEVRLGHDERARRLIARAARAAGPRSEANVAFWPKAAAVELDLRQGRAAAARPGLASLLGRLLMRGEIMFIPAVCNYLALVDLAQGDPEAALEQVGPPWRHPAVRQVFTYRLSLRATLALATWLAGDAPGARVLLEGQAADAAVLGNHYAGAGAGLLLGALDREEGQPERARTRFEAAAAVFGRLGAAPDRAAALCELAGLAVDGGRMSEAAARYAEAETAGIPPHRVGRQATYERDRARLRAAGRRAPAPAGRGGG
jgi:predicted ATPase/DNA-binding SARP family transcriptional activator